ncbi:lipopolysaccharide heptosyltransferase II [Rosettibacter firmus]|uniref:lipopolysaccharide heptosyltransferase II n=1 Tax=Rosettibacter firmus TaxID=3111522 RepID=UPI00336C0C3D
MKDIFKKILIIRLSSLGDILLTTPVIRALKKKYPESSIDFLVKSQYSDVIKYNPYLNKIYEYNSSNLKVLITQLKQNEYELIIDLQNNFRSRLITFQLKSPAYHFKKLSLKKFLLVKFKINLFNKTKTIPERYAETYPQIKLDENGLDLFIPSEIENEIDTNFSNAQVIGFCPGSRHFTKRWPSEYFVELGNKLAEDGYQIFILGGKNDKEICAEISKKIQNSINLQNDDEILKTAVYMKKCKAIVTNDSGLMHTASAIGLPVLVLFGSSVKEFGFTPYKVKNIILENNSLSCRPCSHIGKEKCPEKHFKCMKDLTPDLVYQTLKKLMNSL